MSEHASRGELMKAAADLFECLSSPVRHVLGAASQGRTQSSAAAVTLSPRDAAMCTQDGVRTAMFLRGLDRALRDALQRFPEETIEVVYAGTGPLAPLAIPLLHRFPSGRIQFTFIDIVPESVEAARVVAHHFGVEASIREFLAGDAARYEHPAGQRLHVVVVETMQRALTREPQVAIVRQLARQLVEGGMIVPESIRVELHLRCFAGMVRCGECETAGESGVVVGTLLDLRADVCDLPVDPDVCLPATVLTMPAQQVHATTCVMYETTIVTYRDHVIARGESGLTQPEIVWPLMPVEPRRAYEFKYRIGPVPGFLVSCGVASDA